MKFFGLTITRSHDDEADGKRPLCENQHLRVRCIAASTVQREAMPATGPFTPAREAGPVTTSLMRCDNCGGLFTQSLIGAWTVEQLNGERMADSIVAAFGKGIPARLQDGRVDA